MHIATIFGDANKKAEEEDKDKEKDKEIKLGPETIHLAIVRREMYAKNQEWLDSIKDGISKYTELLAQNVVLQKEIERQNAYIESVAAKEGKAKESKK
jgi:hypothetical protein